MKIIHTSDWHLGHTLYGLDTTAEQQHMLRQIERVCMAENPDLFLLAGDIFDTARPGMAVQKMFVDTIHSLRRQLPDMAIVIIAGNHDSASLHEVFAGPWHQLGVNVLGEITADRAAMADRCVIVDEKCAVVALPYFASRYVSDGYAEQVLDESFKSIPPDLPVVMMMHTTVDGCDSTGHDSSFGRYIGGIEGISVNAICKTVDYLALGHIHRPQTIGNKARYSGSPRMMSFDEAYPHSVSVVTIRHRGDLPEIRDIVIEPLRTLITLPAPGKYAKWDEIISVVAAMQPTDAYFRINIEDGETITPLRTASLRNDMAALGATLCCINRRTAENHEADAETIDFQSFRTLSPLEVADRYLSSIGRPMSEGMERMLQSIIDEITENERLK